MNSPKLQLLAGALTCAVLDPCIARPQNVPPGFEDLARERLLVVDVYFGGEKLTETQTIVAPGTLSFVEPATIASLIPHVRNVSQIQELLSQPLPSNTALSCSTFNATGCGTLTPTLVGVILSEDEFRVDLFIGPQLLESQSASEIGYLSPSSNSPSLTYSVAANVAGDSADSEYFVQNDIIASIGENRFTAKVSESSFSGLTADELVFERDFRGWRGIGGLIYAPGSEFTGRRRIVGAGVATQIDSRRDRDLIKGTPIPLFLPRSSRVELYIDGRLASASFYDAGNVTVDTSELPIGSYPITIRVIEAGTVVREEQQFFSKDDTTPPLETDFFRAFIGALRPYENSLGAPYYEVGYSHRLSDVAALDLSLLGTDEKAIGQAGTTFWTSFGILRGSVTASSDQDYGFRIQVNSLNRSGLSFNADLRRLWAKSDNELLPLNYDLDSLPPDGPGPVSSTGSFVQFNAAARYRRGRLGLGVTGYYLKRDGLEATYAIGPSAELNVIQDRDLRIDVVADAQATDSLLRSFMGVRLFKGFGAANLTGRTGLASQNYSGLPADSRIVGDADFSVSRQTQWGQAQGSVGYTNDFDEKAGRASAFVEHSLGAVRGEVSKDWSNDGSRLQYAASLRSGASYTKGDVSIGGRRLYDSGIMIRLAGSGTASFDILVDNIPRGRVDTGRSEIIYLSPYETYSVKIRPTGNANVAFDATPRSMTLFPGNVAPIEWVINRVVTFFGRALGKDGLPIADATVRSDLGLGRTDAQGFFQIDAGPGGSVLLETKGGTCALNLPTVSLEATFVPLEDVRCLPNDPR